MEHHKLGASYPQGSLQASRILGLASIFVVDSSARNRQTSFRYVQALMY